MLEHPTRRGHATFARDLFPTNIELAFLSFTRQIKMLSLAANARIAYSAQDLLANAPERMSPHASIDNGNARHRDTVEYGDKCLCLVYWSGRISILQQANCR
jgi:hypothetical protein